MALNLDDIMENSIAPLSSGNNPYIHRIGRYPGSLFTYASPDQDVEKIQVLITKYQSLFCELGSGSGQHLISIAAQDPFACCIGFELRFKRAVRTIEKAKVRDLENLFVVRADANNINQIFPSGSVDRMYINFPDPWDKRKQYKHRILSANLLDNLDFLLKPMGFLAVKTDHLEYFEYFLKQLNNDTRFKLTEKSYNLYASEYILGNHQTEFESLFLRQQKPILYCKVIRRQTID